MIFVIRRLGQWNVDPPFSFGIVLTYIIPDFLEASSFLDFVSFGIYNEIILLGHKVILLWLSVCGLTSFQNSMPSILLVFTFKWCYVQVMLTKNHDSFLEMQEGGGGIELSAFCTLYSQSLPPFLAMKNLGNQRGFQLCNAVRVSFSFIPFQWLKRKHSFSH